MLAELVHELECTSGSRVEDIYMDRIIVLLYNIYEESKRRFGIEYNLYTHSNRGYSLVNENDSGHSNAILLWDLPEAPWVNQNTAVTFIFSAVSSALACNVM